MATNFEELVAEVTDELDNMVASGDDPSDIDLDSAVDSQMPSMYVEFFDVLASAPHLATQESDIGGTPYQQIMETMRQAVWGEASEHLETLIDEYDDDDDDDDENPIVVVVVDGTARTFEIVDSFNAVYIYQLPGYASRCAGADTDVQDLIDMSESDPVGFLEAYGWIDG